jgi:hypothetical protein
MITIGQVWQFGNDTETVRSIVGGTVNVCVAGEVGADGFKHTGDGCCWRYIESFEHGRLLADVLPSPHPPRRAGQRWRMFNLKNGKIIEGTLAIEGMLAVEQGGEDFRHWVLTDVVRTDTDNPNPSGAFYHSRWSDIGFTMTLLADAPEQEATECEPWCGSLPPDNAAAYGFIDHGLDGIECLKLPGKRFREAGWKHGWCSFECRDAALPAWWTGKPAQHKVAATMDRRIIISDQIGMERHKVAAKALPVCNVRFSASGCFGEVLPRVLTKAGVPRLCCETCMVAQDDVFARSKHIHGEQTNAPPKPEPLAVVEWLDEWLPEAGR